MVKFGGEWPPPGNAYGCNKLMVEYSPLLPFRLLTATKKCLKTSLWSKLRENLQIQINVSSLTDTNELGKNNIKLLDFPCIHIKRSFCSEAKMTSNISCTEISDLRLRYLQSWRSLTRWQRKARTEAVRWSPTLRSDCLLYTKPHTLTTTGCPHGPMFWGTCAPRGKCGPREHLIWPALEFSLLNKIPTNYPTTENFGLLRFLTRPKLLVLKTVEHKLH